MNNEVLVSNIRELCKKNNITVAHLEKLMSMGAGTISKWNKASPSFDSIMSIARYFKISIDHLSGYTVDGDTEGKLDERTLKVIDYLKKMTIGNEDEYSFWRNYKEDKEVDMLISDLPCMKTDNAEMSRLFYACDGKVYFLLEVVYSLNDYYDYETQIRLYLVPKNSRPLPVLECSDKAALQDLYIAVVRRLEVLELQMEAKAEIQMQRERILEEYNSQNK